MAMTIGVAKAMGQDMAVLVQDMAVLVQDMAVLVQDMVGLGDGVGALDLEVAGLAEVVVEEGHGVVHLDPVVVRAAEQHQVSCA